MPLGLQTARALVIDDDYQEAHPVVLALSRLGIGSLYLNGDLELVRRNGPFRGIRLAFVDMDLQGQGTLSVEDTGRHAASYMSEAVSHDNGLLGILVWTKHQKAAESFFKELRSLLPSSAVLELGVEQKPGDLQIGGPEALDAVTKIVTAVTDRVGKASGMHLLWEWEQLTHEAVTATSENLIEVVRKGTTIKLSELESVSCGLTATLGLLAAAARDRTACTGIEAASQAFSALLPMLQDGAEYAYRQFDTMEEHDLSTLLAVAKDTQVLKDRGPMRRCRYGRLNRMVHVSRLDSGVPLLPGNVYKLTDDLATILSFDTGKVLNGLVSNKYKRERGDTESTVVIAEVSPACDYAQDKVEIPRVIGGALIPIERLNNVPSHDYIYKSFGVVHFDDDEANGLSGGTFHFALNARFLSGLSSALLEERTPLFRIRRNTLVDVQAWLARYGNRPGVITIAR
ncbi:MAG: hypothetical protein OXN97_18725 [Bryobacterales bacterium]|nr:hypothetical protein [Bryobacterales bacterium]MDE0629380.1 hypothetical protein [Bryobacterales bacterium]